MFSAFDDSTFAEDVNSQSSTLDREAILSSEIKDLYVYVTPLKVVNPIMQLFFYRHQNLRKAVAQNVNHAAIIARTENDSLILIEYGAYMEQSNENHSKRFFYYQGNDGLRFIQIPNSTLRLINSDWQNLCIHCKINIKMKISTLLYETHFVKGIQQWHKKDYNIITHNCQDFVSSAIQVLGAIKDSNVDSNKIPLIIQASFAQNERLYL
ncbi:hypothetical protein M9Y10_000295 [Tritrichomonas musculus]|uniref:PPPDE domain-containing protein n=1 Tax=Tritrichomonas musculus TaxID=1915356 RepID=A0ABR2L3T8_9EUKA